MSETNKTAKVADPWLTKKKIRIRKEGTSKSVLAGVNGRMYQIPVNKEVEVPLPIYERLVMREDMLDTLEEIREGIAKEAKESQ